MSQQIYTNRQSPYEAKPSITSPTESPFTAKPGVTEPMTDPTSELPTDFTVFTFESDDFFNFQDNTQFILNA